jgi:hypothetical protein
LFPGKAKQQTTGQVFVIRIVFNDFRHCPSLDNIRRAYIALHGPTKGMTAEFKAAGANIMSYSIGIHQVIIITLILHEHQRHGHI